MAAQLASGFANDHTLMADVTFTAVLQPAPACYPPDVNALAQLLTDFMLKGTIPDNSGGGVFVGNIQPSSSLTQKVWFKIDVAGRPLGIYMFYNGNWRKVYTGNLGDIKYWGGNPNTTDGFDGTGRGRLGGAMDGWALCNGQNGTYNLQDRFIVAADTFSGQWTCGVDPLNFPSISGGSALHVLQPGELPHLSAHVGQSHVASGSGGVGLGSAAPTTPAEVFTGAGAPVGGQAQIKILPPYYALAMIQFIGYA